MKTSEVFRRVRGYLRDEGHMLSRERYICYAIDALYFVEQEIGDRDRTRCKRIVMGLLAPANSLEHWLEDNHRKGITNTPAYKRKIMATRKAWLTHLIEHYEAKGD